MKQTFLIAAISFVTATSIASAHADVTIHSPNQKEFKIGFDLPSGEGTVVDLPKPTGAMGYISIPTNRDKTKMAIVIKDVDGKEIVKATVVDNNHYVLLAAGANWKLVQAGIGAKDEVFSGMVIVNSLPEKYTVDLFGTSGQTGAKNVKISASFDPKNAVKLSRDDNKYKVILTSSDGTKTDALNDAMLGSYLVIHKTYDDKVTASSAGFILSPKAKGKKKGK
jgi:hypothetical protein